MKGNTNPEPEIFGSGKAAGRLLDRAAVVERF